MSKMSKLSKMSKMSMMSKIYAKELTVWQPASPSVRLRNVELASQLKMPALRLIGLILAPSGRNVTTLERKRERKKEMNAVNSEHLVPRQGTEAAQANWWKLCDIIYWWIFVFMKYLQFFFSCAKIAYSAGSSCWIMLTVAAPILMTAPSWHLEVSILNISHLNIPT